MTAKQARLSILRGGVWAFVRIPGGRHFLKDPRATLHWWAAKDCPMEKIVECLGHEAGHLTGEVLDNDILEEKRADEYADAVNFVFKILRLRFS